MRSFIKFTRSLEFAGWICLLTMLSQSFHTFYSFNAVSSIENFLGIIQSGIFVLVFEFFALWYLFRGRENMAKFFAGCLLIMNVYYYWVNNEGLELALGLFIAVIMPVSVYNAASEIKKQLLEEEAAEKAELEKTTQKEKEDSNKLTLQHTLDRTNVVYDMLLSISNRMDSIEKTTEDLQAKKVGRKKKSISV